MFCEYMNKCKISFLNEVTTSDSEFEIDAEEKESPTKARIQHEFETLLKEVQGDYSLISELKCRDANQFLERAKIH